MRVQYSQSPKGCRAPHTTKTELAIPGPAELGNSPPAIQSVGVVEVRLGCAPIDEIDAQIGAGKDRFQPVVDSGRSRLMPVSMAAATTILGMILLLQDAFFVSMAVTIMVGLGFAPIPPAPRGSRIS